MVLLRVEELEPRIVPSGDLLSQLVAQVRSVSHSNIDFFEQLSAWMYLSLKPQTNSIPARPTEADAILASDWAACSDRNLIMQVVAESFGFQARSVPFYGVPYQVGHVTTEILIGGSWHFFDATTGIYFTVPGGSTPLSYASAAALYPNIEIWEPPGKYFWTGNWHGASAIKYAPLQENILYWIHNHIVQPVFNVELTYFVQAANSPDRSRQVSGDFTGDGRTDVASYDSASHTWSVALTQPDGQITVSRWGHFGPSYDWETVVAGDFTGDGRDDIAIYYAPTRTWWVGLSTAQDTFTFQAWLKMPSRGWGKPLVGDFTGDGRTDLAFYKKSSRTWWVAVPQGSSFVLEKWAAPGIRGWGTAYVGDFNGDGRDDLAMYRRADRTWWVAVSQGDSFVFQQWAAPAQTGWGAVRVGDFTGDGRDDLALYRPADGTWWVALSVGATFTFQQWGQLGLHGSKVVLIGDLNGDGQSDIAAYQASTRQWFVGISTGDSFTFSPTGSPVTLASWAHPLLADFTGDGVDDIAVYRPFNARWWVDLPSA